MPVFVRAINALSRYCGYLSAVFLVSAVLVVCQLVFVRYILEASAIWQHEYVTLALIIATFLGAPYVLSTKGHVRVNLLSVYSPPHIRRWLDTVAHLIGLAFCLFVTYKAIPWFYEALHEGWNRAGLWEVPLWLFHLPLPLGMGLVCLQYIVEIYETLIGEDSEELAHE